MALSAAVLGLGLGAALLLGTALAPTDPVLASNVVTGRPAETTLPERDRVVLSLESAPTTVWRFRWCWPRWRSRHR